MGSDHGREAVPTVSGEQKRQQHNNGSRFVILDDQNEMETDNSDSPMRSKQNIVESDGHEGEEVVMEEAVTEKDGVRQVNISVSQEALTEEIRPLTKMKTNFWVAAQDKDGGQKKMNGRSLKDITNKLEARLVIAKSSRPIMSTFGAQNAGGYRILKRPGEVWRSEQHVGPPSKSPDGDEASSKKLQASGSGIGRPPDPPDISMNVREDESPRSPIQ